MTFHGQMGGQNVLEYVLGFIVTLVLWGNAYIKYHIIIRNVLVVLLVLLDIEFATLIPLP